MSGFFAKVVQHSVLVLGAGWCGLVAAQPYGMDQHRLVGLFLNGTLPSSLPTSTNWQVVDAFPNLRFAYSFQYTASLLPGN